MLSLARVLDGLQVEIDPRDGGGAALGRDGASPWHASRVGVVELSGGGCVWLSRGTAMIVPPGRRPPVGLADPDRNVLVVRGRARASYRGSADLFERLEEPLVEQFAPDDPLGAAVEALLDEMAAERPGARAMVEALLRRCLILLLRRRCGNASEHVAWLAPLEDARLGRALATMHARPEQAFTLPHLARVAGMSRSVFAARFSEALGLPPMEFLKSLRLTRAAHLLTHTDLPVKSIAARAGYSSRSSFTRAFRAGHGAGPAAFRAAARRHTAGPPAATEGLRAA